MDNYDRWKLYNPNDDEKELCNCDECGREIYIGEEMFLVNDDIIHTDCFDDYAKRILIPIYRIAGENS